MSRAGKDEGEGGQDQEFLRPGDTLVTYEPFEGRVSDPVTITSQ